MWKELMLHISHFCAKKYADKGGFPLSLKFYKANRRLKLPKKNSNFGRKDVSSV